MKIDNHEPIIKNLYPEANSKSQSSSGQEFGTILKETVENTRKADEGPRQTAFINPLAGVQLTTPASPDSQFTIERIENLIDLLDQYRHKLADPQINLKQMGPIIKEIARENDHLAPVAGSLSHDNELKDILNRIRVTASLEIARFYRGDYIAA
ncbi:MAG: hypothetical protein JRF47_06500 [Deltaproteobacteria bacterium]|jgi:hypothetical protein|nr:hypothetical protein [Deltaproteobacteria bacterium]MBW2583739.1 hypothetical protein [Deltaproteobacteria bacterium]MBW2657167.1 hypothetical protein [Deltaproteobacteria bacterium]